MLKITSELFRSIHSAWHDIPFELVWFIVKKNDIKKTIFSLSSASNRLCDLGQFTLILGSLCTPEC